MAEIIGIYKITNPENKIYVGKSINIKKRWIGYKNLFCEQQPLLYESFKKHGVENHKFEVLCECEKSQLNVLEIYYIKYYNSFNINKGLNLTTGGENGYVFSIETRLKIKYSNKNLGRKHAEETKSKMRKSHQCRINKQNNNENQNTQYINEHNSLTVINVIFESVKLMKLLTQSALQ
jgi:group I intron endonuclease